MGKKKKGTAQRSVKQYSNWLIILWLAAILLVFVVGQATWLICDRIDEGRADCKIERRLLGSLTLRRQTIRNVMAAYATQEEDGSYIYYVELLTPEETVRLTSSTSDLEIKDAIVKPINDFLLNPDGVSITVSEKEYSYARPVSAAALGLCAVLTIAFMIIAFIRRTG